MLRKGVKMFIYNATSLLLGIKGQTNITTQPCIQEPLLLKTAVGQREEAGEKA